MTDFELRVIEAALEDAYFTKLVPTENLLKFARAIREIVVEECARLADTHGYDSGNLDCLGCGEEIGAAIRALTKGEG